MLERIRFQSTDQLLDALRERQEQAGIARPKPAAASTEGDDSAVFLTAAAGLVEPTTAMASTVGDDAPQPAHLRVNMERLAAQVAENFDTYGKYNKLTKALIIGGTSMDEQSRVLDKGVDVLIATPGRLLDLVNQGFIHLCQSMHQQG